MGRKPKNKLSYYKKKADRALQEFYRAKELKCEGCGQPATTMHHFFTKSSASSLRYYDSNLIAVCRGCHLRHHMGDPRLHASVMQKRKLGWYQDLLKQKNELVRPTKSYYEKVIKKYNPLNKIV